MILRRLILKDFRSYPNLDLEFGEGKNLILGNNASGKTNLAEAIHFLSLAKSWRTQEEGSLIRLGCPMASVRAFVEEGILRREILIEITPQGKRIFVNGKPARRLGELSKVVNVLLFAPEDVRLFQGPPLARRNFLDIGLSKRSNDYLTLIARQNSLLKSRNALLKDGARDKALLEVITDQLIDVQEPIVRYRTMYVTSLNAVLPKLLGALRGVNAPCSLLYRSFVKDDGSFKERAKKAYSDALEGDILHKGTSVGVQREDFSVRLSGKDIREFGSQGENRMVALALKLSPFFLVEEAEKKPICVLDDVTSELDADNVARLLSVLDGLGQSFLTATDLSLTGASVFEVADHKATRRN
ncbi:MAG: DNA replication and repair protein RecF [Bacilli bacterium]|nr:DNA replication and repair protein RecF [Bacilli bacterium]